MAVFGGLISLSFEGWRVWDTKGFGPFPSLLCPRAGVVTRAAIVPLLPSSPGCHPEGSVRKEEEEGAEGGESS